MALSTVREVWWIMTGMWRGVFNKVIKQADIQFFDIRVTFLRNDNGWHKADIGDASLWHWNITQLTVSNIITRLGANVCIIYASSRR